MIHEKAIEETDDNVNKKTSNYDLDFPILTPKTTPESKLKSNKKKHKRKEEIISIEQSTEKVQTKTNEQENNILPLGLTDNGEQSDDKITILEQPTEEVQTDTNKQESNTHLALIDNRAQSDKVISELTSLLPREITRGYPTNLPNLPVLKTALTKLLQALPQHTVAIPLSGVTALTFGSAMALLATEMGASLPSARRIALTCAVPNFFLFENGIQQAIKAIIKDPTLIVHILTGGLFYRTFAKHLNYNHDSKLMYGIEFVLQAIFSVAMPIGMMSGFGAGYGAAHDELSYLRWFTSNESVLEWSTIIPTMLCILIVNTFYGSAYFNQFLDWCAAKLGDTKDQNRQRQKLIELVSTVHRHLDVVAANDPTYFFNWAEKYIQSSGKEYIALLREIKKKFKKEMTKTKFSKTGLVFTGLAFAATGPTFALAGSFRNLLAWLNVPSTVNYHISYYLKNLVAIITGVSSFPLSFKSGYSRGDAIGKFFSSVLQLNPWQGLKKYFADYDIIDYFILSESSVLALLFAISSAALALKYPVVNVFSITLFIALASFVSSFSNGVKPLSEISESIPQFLNNTRIELQIALLKTNEKPIELGTLKTLTVLPVYNSPVLSKDIFQRQYEKFQLSDNPEEKEFLAQKRYRKALVSNIKNKIFTDKSDAGRISAKNLLPVLSMFNPNKSFKNEKPTSKRKSVQTEYNQPKQWCGIM